MTSRTDTADHTRDDGRIWGYAEAGIFWAVPKGPMIAAGYGPAPFAIALPDGRIRQIVHQPEGSDV